MKKIWYLLLAAHFCMTIVPKYVFAYHPVAAQADDNTVKVEAIQEEGKLNYFHYQLSIPRLSLPGNKKLQKQVNAYYEDSITSFRKKLEKEAKRYYEGAQQGTESIHPYIANVDYTVTLQTPTLLSLYVNYYQYTGGAHGTYDWQANTFDLVEKKELALVDLFQEKSSYLDMIKQEMKQQIERDKEKFFPDAAELATKATSFKFFLEPEQLVIYYPLYEIAPYASGIPAFRIPYTLLQNEFKPNYRKILIDK